jgi:hypothetical protein
MFLTRMTLTAGVILAALIAQASAQTTQPSDQPAATQPTTTAPSDVVAEIAGKKLTYGQMEATKSYFLPPQVEDDFVIARWKVMTVLADDARQSKMYQDDPYLKAAIENMADELLVRAYLRYRQMNVEVSDEEVQKFYNEAKETPQFRKPPFVSAKLIAAKTKEDIDKIYDRLIAGDDFDKVMQEFGEQTKLLTGLSSVAIDNVSVETLTPSLGPVITSQLSWLPESEFDKPKYRPTKGKDFWLIYKLTARKPGELIPFDEVREQIKKQVLQQKTMDVINQLKKSAEERAGVQLPAGPPSQGPSPQRPSPHR